MFSHSFLFPLKHKSFAQLIMSDCYTYFVSTNPAHPPNFSHKYPLKHLHKPSKPLTKTQIPHLHTHVCQYIAPSTLFAQRPMRRYINNVRDPHAYTNKHQTHTHIRLCTRKHNPLCVRLSAHRGLFMAWLTGRLY